jgi:hypothetical protein
VLGCRSDHGAHRQPQGAPCCRTAGRRQGRQAQVAVADEKPRRPDARADSGALPQELNNYLADAEYNYWDAQDATEHVEVDLAVLHDLQTLTLAALRADTAINAKVYDVPHVRSTDRAIQWRMAQARAELAFLSGVRALNLREEFGTERGAQGRMAEALDVTPSAVSQMLATADRRVSALRELAVRMNEASD